MADEGSKERPKLKSKLENFGIREGGQKAPEPPPPPPPPPPPEPAQNDD